MPISSSATVWLSKLKVAFCATLFTTVLTKCNPGHVSCSCIRKLVFYMSKEPVIGKRYENAWRGGWGGVGWGKYGGSFSPFILEQLGPISQPERIKESEMDCVDCSFVLLDSLFLSLLGVILQCQIQSGVDSPLRASLIVRPALSGLLLKLAAYFLACFQTQRFLIRENKWTQPLIHPWFHSLAYSIQSNP